MATSTLSPGDEWPYHYRGYALQVSPDREVWWQVYQGTDRLFLDSTPTEIVDRLLEQKRIGGRIHITEGAAVLTRVEEEDDTYTNLYLGETTIDGQLIPQDAPEYSIEVQPKGLSSGDLWPSVYDGARYSFVEDRIWWQNGSTHRRHPVTTDLPEEIMRELRSYKPNGGSFRVTPWGDVITLVDMHPTPETVERQFADLPRVVKNIIRLRKERDVEMLPVYIGKLENPPIEVREPTTLTDELSSEEMEELSSWAQNLGRTSATTQSSHQSSDTRNSNTGTTSEKTSGHSDDNDPSKGPRTDSEGRESTDESTDDEPDSFDDDPLEWIEKEVRFDNTDQ